MQALPQITSGEEMHCVLHCSVLHSSTQIPESLILSMILSTLLPQALTCNNNESFYMQIFLEEFIAYITWPTLARVMRAMETSTARRLDIFWKQVSDQILMSDYHQRARWRTNELLFLSFYYFNWRLSFILLLGHYCIIWLKKHPQCSDGTIGIVDCLSFCHSCCHWYCHSNCHSYWLSCCH